MKKLFCLAALAALIGCDYTVPLTDAPVQDIDTRVVGLWSQTRDDGQPERLLVLPLGAREYLVNYPVDTNNGMFARACLCPCAGETLVQVQWFGTARGKQPEDKRVYQFATFTVTGDELRVRLLNPDVVGREIGSTTNLVRAIEALQDDPRLFRDPMVFRKVVEARDQNAR